MESSEMRLAAGCCRRIDKEISLGTRQELNMFNLGEKVK
jgi:hypothetical protein